MTLATLILVDEYDFVVHPRIVGHGPNLFAGLSKFVALKLVEKEEISSGMVALKYVPGA